jgi:hypothetical protein
VGRRGSGDDQQVTAKVAAAAVGCDGGHLKASGSKIPAGSALPMSSYSAKSRPLTSGERSVL